MKKELILFIGLLFFQTGLWAMPELEHDLRSELWGRWRYTGYIYQGQFQESPNPDLEMTFDFYQDGTDLLHWHRRGERGFCERRGRYQFDGEYLIDEVYWVNPLNRRDCSSDPDMRSGLRQITPARSEHDHLFVDLPLGDETVVYVWERVPWSSILKAEKEATKTSSPAIP